jgi:hypothetical protein
MIVRTSLVAFAVLGLASAMQLASAQEPMPAPAANGTATPSIEASQEVVTEQSAVAPHAAMPTPPAPEATTASADQSSSSTGRVQCRWRRSERSGIGFLLVPVDLVREGLSAVRRGTTRAC